MGGNEFGSLYRFLSPYRNAMHDVKDLRACLGVIGLKWFLIYSAFVRSAFITCIVKNNYFRMYLTVVKMLFIKVFLLMFS